MATKLLDQVPKGFVVDPDAARAVQMVDFDPAKPQIVLRGKQNGKGQWKEIVVKLHADE